MDCFGKRLLLTCFRSAHTLISVNIFEVSLGGFLEACVGLPFLCHFHCKAKLFCGEIVEKVR